MGVKIAITGKGGVGKTTLSALLATMLAGEGERVLAVDADPSMSLGAALGFPSDVQPSPLVDMKELIAERMGTGPDGVGAYFTLNPRVEDIPEAYCVRRDGLSLLVMGGVARGGGGCACAANAFLRALLQHLLLERGDVVILDMEAGVEHLGRATADAVDALVAVVEPSRVSTQTALRIRDLAGQIGLERVFIVGNKVSGDEDECFIAEQTAGLPYLGAIPLSPWIAESERRGNLWQSPDPAVLDRVRAIKESLLEAVSSK
jgi:CO dehydrogenase maturation factor